jgi:hypothetical protein
LSNHEHRFCWHCSKGSMAHLHSACKSWTCRTYAGCRPQLPMASPSQHSMYSGADCSLQQQCTCVPWHWS